MKLAQLEQPTETKLGKYSAKDLWFNNKKEAVPFAEIENMDMLLWCADAGIDDDFTKNHAYCKHAFVRGKQLYIVFFDHVVGAHITIMRSFNPKTYLIYKDSKDAVFHLETYEETDTIVLTEDAVSAIHVANAGFHSLALLGTNFTSTHLTRLRDYGYKKFIIHLDDDPAGMKGALDAATQLRSITGSKINNTPMLSGEPKHMTKIELINLYSGLSL